MVAFAGSHLAQHPRLFVLLNMDGPLNHSGAIAVRPWKIGTALKIPAIAMLCDPCHCRPFMLWAPPSNGHQCKSGTAL